MALLHKAFELGERVIIGVTSDEFAKSTKNKVQINNNFDKRQDNLKKLIDRSFKDTEYSIIKLESYFGKEVLSENVQALITSTETFEKALEINRRRKEIELDSLFIIALEMVKSEDGKIISSTRIRAGEIDPEGHLLTQ